LQVSSDGLEGNVAAGRRDLLGWQERSARLAGNMYRLAGEI
jgi:hypothetical protein